MSRKVECIRNYILDTYNKKAHLTILNFTEYENLNENLIETFNLKEFSLKEIKKILDIKSSDK